MRPFRAVASTAAALALVVVVAAPAFPTATARPAPCSTPARPVPPRRVPADVTTWAHGAAVIGTGSLWALRGALDGRAVRRPDGTQGMKFPWYVKPPGGVPTIRGVRLDGPGLFRADANVAIDGARVFATSSLIFSTPGCWRVTGTYRTSTVTFRIPVRPDPPTG